MPAALHLPAEGHEIASTKAWSYVSSEAKPATTTALPHVPFVSITVTASASLLVLPPAPQLPVDQHEIVWRNTPPGDLNAFAHTPFFSVTRKDSWAKIVPTA